MATTTASGSGVKNNGGAILGAGNTTEYKVVHLGSASHAYGSRVTLSQSAHLNSALKTAAVTLSSVADDGSGFCDFTKSSHGLSVGTYIMVSGSTSGNLDTVHKITSVPDANSIVTNVPYVASATAGVYKLVSGNLAKLVQGKYIGYLITSEIAGVSNTVLEKPASDSGRRSINPTTSERRLDITSWNYLTGAATKGANAGASYDFKNADGSGSIDNSLTLAELVMLTGGKNPVYYDYA